VCQTLPTYKAELLIDELEKHEAIIDAINGSPTKRKRRKNTNDNRPKKANTAVEAVSAMLNAVRSLLSYYAVSEFQNQVPDKIKRPRCKTHTIISKFSAEGYWFVTTFGLPLVKKGGQFDVDGKN
jgi:hypothetical protein